MSNSEIHMKKDPDTVEKRLKIFRERLQDFLDERALKKADFAKASGISLARVYAILRGNAAPSLETALKAADYFRCTLDYLFGFREDYRERNYAVVASVCERVKESIDASSLSRYKLSRMTGIDQSDLHHWYHGRKTPELVSLLRLAEPLNASLDYLSGREE